MGTSTLNHAPTAGHTAELPTTTGLDHRKLLMWAFLGSECLFFGSLISAYLVYQGESLVGPFPHEIFNIPYTSVSAFVLLMPWLPYSMETRGAYGFGWWLRRFLAVSLWGDRSLSLLSL